jgi:hypothetical protein
MAIGAKAWEPRIEYLKTRIVRIVSFRQTYLDYNFEQLVIARVCERPST